MGLHPVTDALPGTLPRTAAAASAELLALAAAIPVAAIASLGATTNLTAVPGTFADEAAVQTYLVALRADVEARLDAIEVRVDAVLAALRTATVLAA